MGEIVFEKWESTARSFISLEKDVAGSLIPVGIGVPAVSGQIDPPSPTVLLRSFQG